MCCWDGIIKGIFVCTFIIYAIDRCAPFISFRVKIKIKYLLKNYFSIA